MRKLLLLAPITIFAQDGSQLPVDATQQILAMAFQNMKQAQDSGMPHTTQYIIFFLTIAISGVGFLAKYWNEQSKRVTAAETASRKAERDKEMAANKDEAKRDSLAAMAVANETKLKLENHFASHGTRELSLDQRFKEIDMRFNEVADRLSTIEKNMISKDEYIGMQKTLVELNAGIREMTAVHRESFKRYDDAIQDIKADLKEYEPSQQRPRRKK